MHTACAAEGAVTILATTVTVITTITTMIKTLSS